jgi:DNA polymerase-3 subunit delta'
VTVRSHTDLAVLMPETVMMELGWPLGEKAQADIDDKKRKPSREIRVDAMRDMLEFAQRTSGRGRGKVVMVYPAERMNQITANALLKTLEEPPGDDALRAGDGSRAPVAAHHSQPLPGPRPGLARNRRGRAWLQEQGVPAAARRARWPPAPARDACAPARAGLDAGPGRNGPSVGSGRHGALANWSPAQLVEAFQKLCHEPAGAAIPGRNRALEARRPARGGLSLPALTAVGQPDVETSRTVEHPFNAG